MRKVDDHLASISSLLRDAAERSEECPMRRAPPERELSLDLEELLTNTIAEAAARTGAEAVGDACGGPRRSADDGDPRC